MGPEITYSFDCLGRCCVACGKKFRVHGYISEYFIGAYNYEDINVEDE